MSSKFLTAMGEYVKGKYIIAHDLGTRGNKASLLDFKGNIISSFFEGYKVIYPHPNWAEQDPYTWWKAIVESTNNLVDETKISGDDVAAITFSAQMAGALPVDRNGEPLMNAMIWLDSRATQEVKEFLNPIRTLLIFRITGGIPGPKDTLSKILWVKRNREDIWKKTHKFLDCKDYLIYKTTGKYITSKDCASATWMLDTRLGREDWSPTILKWIGITKDKLPKVKNSTEIVGYLTKNAAKEMNLREGIPVVNGAGDVASAVVGSGAVGLRDVHLYIGTSGWIVAPVKKRITSIKHYMGSILSADPKKYNLIGEQEVAGEAYKWLQEKIFDRYTYREMDELASQAPVGSKKLIFLPWLFGERCPLNDPTIRGGFFNLSLEHGKEEILRATMEGVAYHVRWMLEGLESLIGEVKEINIIGGGANSDIWCQIFADVTGKKINQVEKPQEATSRGAGLIATVALGIHKSIEDIKNYVPIKRVFVSKKGDKSVYEELYPVFKKLYSLHAPLARKLNKNKGV